MHKTFDIHGLTFVVWGYGWAHRPDDGRLALRLAENYFRLHVGGEAPRVWQELKEWDGEGKAYPAPAGEAVKQTQAAFLDAYRLGVEPGVVWIGAR